MEPAVTGLHYTMDVLAEQSKSNQNYNLGSIIHELLNLENLTL